MLSQNSSQRGGDTTQLMDSSSGSDMAELSSVSSVIYASIMSSYSMGSDTDELLTDSTGIDAASLTDSSLGSEVLEILFSSTEDQRYDCLKCRTPSSVPPLTLMPVAKGLEETLYQAATLEGKSSESPSMRYVMQNTTESNTRGMLDMPHGLPANLIPVAG